MNAPQFSFALCAAICALAGCASQTPATSPATANAPATAMTPAAKTGNNTPVPTATLMNARDMKPDTKNYRVRGLVKGVEKSVADGRMTLNVSHETIPNFMNAMEIRVPFAKNDDAKNVKAGDKIAFNINRSNLEVSNIKKLPPATQLKLK